MSSSSLLCTSPRMRVKKSMEKQREKQRSREGLMMGDKNTGKQCRGFSDSICPKSGWSHSNSPIYPFIILKD